MPISHKSITWIPRSAPLTTPFLLFKSLCIATNSIWAPFLSSRLVATWSYSFCMILLQELAGEGKKTSLKLLQSLNTLDGGEVDDSGGTIVKKNCNRNFTSPILTLANTRMSKYQSLTSMVHAIISSLKVFAEITLLVVGIAIAINLSIVISCNSILQGLITRKRFGSCVSSCD